MRSLTITCAIYAAMAAAAAPCRAQALAAASPLPRDSLWALADVARLRALLRDAAALSNSDWCVKETYRGNIALRIGDLDEGRESLDEAIRYFDEAVYRDGRCAEGWLGLAEAKRRLEARGAVVKESMHQRGGDYYGDAAVGHLAQALQVRPVFPEAVQLLGELVEPLDAPELSEAAVVAVRVAAAHDENGPLPQLLSGRYLLKQGALEQSQLAFDKFAALGGSRAVAALETSRVLFAQGKRDEAVTAYRTGASEADSAGRAAYRRDIRWLASPAELTIFDTMALADVGPWIASFWATRDATELRKPGERLQEHMRRWFYVQEHFRLVGRRKGARFNWGQSGIHQKITSDNEGLGIWNLFAPGTLSEADPRSLGVDDRGAVYMRHGEPSGRASAIGAGAINGSAEGGCEAANESWKYDLPTGPIVFHFCASEALGMTAPTTLVAMLPLDPAIVGARGTLDVQFGLLELDILQYLQAVEMRQRGITSITPRISQETATRLQQFGKASLQVGLTTDSYPLTYRRSLEPTVQIFGLPETADRGKALLVFGIRGEHLTVQRIQGHLVYPVHFRVTAVDTAHGLVSSMDTLRMFGVADTLRSSDVLYGTLVVDLAPGTYYVRALLDQPELDAGGAAGRYPVIVPGDTSGFVLSDLIPGPGNTILKWNYLGTAINLSPQNAYAAGTDIELFARIKGATPRRSYRMAVRLRRVSGRMDGGKNELEIGFREQAPAAEFNFQKAISINQLGSGRYVLTLTVTDDVTHQEENREAVVNVLERGR